MPLENAVVLPVDPAQSFALFTRPEGLRRWMAITARIEPYDAGVYRWTVTPGHTAVGAVVEADPGQRLVLSWGWEGYGDPAPGSRR